MYVLLLLQPNYYSYFFLNEICIFLQVLYSYGLGFVYILVALTVTGNIFPAFQFCQQVSQPSSYFLF